VKFGKPGLPRLPRLQQNNNRGAQSSTVRRGARPDDTTAAAAVQPRTPAAAGDGGLAAAAKDRGRLPERLAASVHALVPAGIVGPAAPSGGTARTSPRDDAVADSGTGAPARPQNTDGVATRLRALVQDTATTTLHQPSGALVDKPLADSVAALVHTDDSTLNRHTAESVSPTAAFTPHLTAAPPAGPTATVVSSLLAGVGITSPSGMSTGNVPVAPMPLMLGVLQLMGREIEHTFLNEASGVASSTVAPRSLVTFAAAATTTQPNTGASSTSPGVPQPGDVVNTDYGDVGIWMLKSNGQISNWGGQKHDRKTLLEPINVIIIDPTSTTREESIKKLNRAMSAAGLPAQGLHSTGYQGIIDGDTYSQQPTGVLQAFADNMSPQDHGRMFGPAPAASGQGYVWTGAFSTEGSTHQYLSFDMARDDLASRLVLSGAATRLDDVSMGNAETTGGDHDGYAVVLQLSAVMPNTPPSTTVTQNKPSTSTGKVTGKVTAVDPDKDKLTYTTMNTAKGTVTVTSTGSFTYTPTAAARHAAAADNAADKTDTFSITVDDGFGGVIAVPVTVAVVSKNGAPSPKVAVNKADPVGGTVTGSIVVTDADGDIVTYSATNPASGSVTVNPDGTFSYNPTEAARQQARIKKAIGTDKFTITVDDGHGGVKTVTVTARIAPTDRAPVTGILDIGVPRAINGAVKGSLTASDPDDDTYSFSGSTKTANGYVSVSSKGTFTYTPTAAARRAAATTGDKTDTFTITVTDKYGATAVTTVEVPILSK
jgi:VCBS repeat-containing protein